MAVSCSQQTRRKLDWQSERRESDAGEGRDADGRNQLGTIVHVSYRDDMPCDAIAIGKITVVQGTSSDCVDLAEVVLFCAHCWTASSLRRAGEPRDNPPEL
jgi:hypothetical protein